MTETEIRNGWEKALATMNITDISCAISWGFFKQDLCVLACLHMIGTAAEKIKIEELLEDCNFHTFCGHLHDGDYENAIRQFKHIIED